ncbi:MAG: citrate synthase [Candidatus Omnitrophica bacterium]|nr:citrate synthase [Candidatus Omnitrophota bacterium]
MLESGSVPTPHAEAHKFSKGLEGVVAAETALSLVDGERSRLLYRGISIHELAVNSTYEETVFLLWNGRLPRSTELSTFQKDLAAKRTISKEIIQFLKSLPKSAHPMAVLRSAISLLGAYDPEERKIDPDSIRDKAFSLIAKFPTLIAAFKRIREGAESIESDPQLSQAADFLYRMHGKKPEMEMERAMDAYLILLADHGLNASTFSARVTASTEADIYSAVTSAIGTLKGDLHGSANQRAMEMILDIGTPEKAEKYVKDLLAHKKKVMGFGHRIYKKEDPRATAFRGIAAKLCERSGEKKWMEISNIIEKTMWREKEIPCNVDFFSASVLYILGIPVDFFTTVFAASRVAGWTAHVMEQRLANKLIRPQAEYTGPLEELYIPMEKRK